MFLTCPRRLRSLILVGLRARDRWGGGDGILEDLGLFDLCFLADLWVFGTGDRERRGVRLRRRDREFERDDFLHLGLLERERDIAIDNLEKKRNFINNQHFKFRIKCKCYASKICWTWKFVNIQIFHHIIVSKSQQIEWLITHHKILKNISRILHKLISH